MRRSAKILNINRKTVERKLQYLANLSRRSHAAYLQTLKSPNQQMGEIQFDELETLEHSKCKPVSVALAVKKGDRKILAFEVAQMPTKGHLAKISRQKYGFRRDNRPIALSHLMSTLAPITQDLALIESDQNPHYAPLVKRYFPKATHIQHKGQRGCVAGQGELKKIGFDPLFSLNHTCAMLRANINRLFRRTWCTSKRINRLEEHLWIYVGFHNQVLT